MPFPIASWAESAIYVHRHIILGQALKHLHKYAMHTAQHMVKETRAPGENCQSSSPVNSR